MTNLLTRIFLENEENMISFLFSFRFASPFEASRLEEWADAEGFLFRFGFVLRSCVLSDVSFTPKRPLPFRMTGKQTRIRTESIA